MQIKPIIFIFHLILFLILMPGFSLGTPSLVLLYEHQAHAFEVRGLKTPKSFIADPLSENYFISNINGKPTEKDNNGFITKLDHTGKIMSLKFIEGGRDGVTLHAPKGLAIIDNILFVTDIDYVWGFDKESGQLLYQLDLSRFDPAFLNGLTHDIRGNLYITNMTAQMILKIDTRNGFETSILAKDPRLQQPNGIAVNPRTGNLIVVTWDTGSILEVDQTGQVRVLLDSKGLKRLDGVDLDDDGNIYTSSFTDGRIYKISPDFKRVRLFKEGLTSPADINLDRRKHFVLIPLFNQNKARAEKFK